MCGIAGIVRFNNRYKVTEKQIKKTLVSLQTRGRDATGIAWLHGSEYSVLKTPAPATDFVELKEFKRLLPEMMDSRILLFHTRAATHGSPLNNLNNHPLWNSDGMIIHNGVVFPPKDLPSRGETDSEQIMLYVQKYGWKGLEQLRGWLSIAYIDFQLSNLYLYSEGAPLCMERNSNFCSFASTPQVLHNFEVNKVVQPEQKTVYRISKGGEFRVIAEINKKEEKRGPLVGTSSILTQNPAGDWVVTQRKGGPICPQEYVDGFYY
jgi:glucosamine 6-phosphate synthetase-like amidotransferase/phosphosugar isomerase protein